MKVHQRIRDVFLVDYFCNGLILCDLQALKTVLVDFWWTIFYLKICIFVFFFLILLPNLKSIKVIIVLILILLLLPCKQLKVAVQKQKSND